MNLSDHNQKLSEQEINRFIESCPESIDSKQFMALVCLMAEQYGFETETTQRMLMRVVNCLEINSLETPQQCNVNNLEDNDISPNTIKDFRKRNKLTQADLARELGYSRSMIAQIETGAHVMTKTTKKLMKYFIEDVDNGRQNDRYN